MESWTDPNFGKRVNRRCTREMAAEPSSTLIEVGEQTARTVSKYKSHFGQWLRTSTLEERSLEVDVDAKTLYIGSTVDVSNHIREAATVRIHNRQGIDSGILLGQH